MSEPTRAEAIEALLRAVGAFIAEVDRDIPDLIRWPESVEDAFDDMRFANVAALALPPDAPEDDEAAVERLARFLERSIGGAVAAESYMEIDWMRLARAALRAARGAK